MRSRAVSLEAMISRASAATDSSVAHHFNAFGNWTAALALIVLFTSGCATPVGVKRLDEQAAHRELGANILSAGTPSAYSRQLLERTALSDSFKSDPELVLAELNSGLGRTDERDRLFALSELSFA